MSLNPLTAVSPIDGRYHSKTEVLHQYFSEMAFFKYRIKVEVEYFIALCQIPLPQLEGITGEHFATLRSIYQSFTLEDAEKIKEIEKITNHDIKAVEYFIKYRMIALGLGQYKEFIHFGLTSQDINNTAIPLAINDVFDQVYYPQLAQLLAKLTRQSAQWNDIPLLAHTHGQAATPTRLGKEIKVFVERLTQQIYALQAVPYAAKFGGATGNYNAHVVAYPEIDWKKFGTHFIEDILGLHHSFPTTQIEHYDHLAALFDALKRINTILIDLSRDIWAYIAMGYFQQKIKSGETGSSTMPHKVNPIDFENAEGNLGLANALLAHLSVKLPISRLQRDLTDSTVLRNIGVPFGHILIAFSSLQEGLDKLIVDLDTIAADLNANWAVVSEAIQTILRRENFPNPYETLKELTRNNASITKDTMMEFIDNLEISDAVKSELKAITPFNYTGI